MDWLKLVNLLKGHKVYLQTHNFPDPDALASAFGMQVFLRAHGVESTICYSGYKSGKPDFTDYSDRSFVTRHDKLGTPDIILVFGGTNDSWAGSPIGEYQYENWTRKDLFSFRPAMACLLVKLIDRYPNVEIVFLLNDELGEVIDESVKTICQHYGVKCVEFERIHKINGHPSVQGMKQISDQLKAFFERENIR